MVVLCGQLQNCLPPRTGNKVMSEPAPGKAYPMNLFLSLNQFFMI